MSATRAVVLGAVALLAGTSVSFDSMAGSGPVRPPVPWSHLPPGLRSLVHPTARDIPRFPGESDSLLDVRRWPKEWQLEGRTLYLRFREQGRFGETTVGLHDVTQIHPGFDYTAYYVSLDDDPGRPGPRALPGSLNTDGPLYAWRADSSLVYRSYRTSSLHENWTYDDDGRLFFYHRRSSRPLPRTWLSCERKPSQWHAQTEWYSEDGHLVALQTEEGAYWNGVRMSYRAYADSIGRWREVRYPMRGPFQQ